MAKIIGYDKDQYKRLTCNRCCAIIEYNGMDTFYAKDGYGGGTSKVIECPGCKCLIEVS